MITLDEANLILDFVNRAPMNFSELPKANQVMEILKREVGEAVAINTTAAPLADTPGQAT